MFIHTTVDNLFVDSMPSFQADTSYKFGPSISTEANCKEKVLKLVCL